MLGSFATEEALTELRHELGHDQPLPVQYVRWLGHVVRGDLGDSIWLGVPVLEELLSKFSATLILAATSFVLSTATGIVLGIIAGVNRNSIFDRLSMFFALFGISMPIFWLGIMLIVAFSVHLDILPPTGMHSPRGDGGTLDLLKHLILPAVTLAAPNVAIVARLTRSSMLEVIGLDYIRTARSKGIIERHVILRHALKNALIPVVTVIGLQLGLLLSGSILVEVVFSWPGLGQLMVNAISQRDFPLVQGATLMIAVGFVLVNLVVDLSYAYLDPRIKYS
jgi:peptide/nickel transport system permease protein